MASFDKNTKVYDWYHKAYADTQGDYLDKNVTFQQVIDTIEDDPGNLYSILGVDNNEVRDRIFTAVAGIVHKPYQAVYARWYDNSKPSIKESKTVELTPGAKVASWYKNHFPSDELGEDIDDKVTFNQLIDCVNSEPGKFYDVIGVGDSVVRERLFTAIANLLKVPYQAVYDRWLLGDDAPALKESVYSPVVMEYLLEGKNLTEALELAEDTITPDNIEKITQTPAYKKLQRDLDYFFNACDDVIEYRDTDFKDHPIEALEDEADFCKAAANFLGSIQLKGFDPKQTQDLMSATASDMEYLDNSAKRLKNILAKQDDSVYLNDDGSVNTNTNQKPAEYARRALRKISDFFARLGLAWDYDPDYYGKHPEQFLDLDKILKNRQKKGKNLAMAGESKSWKKELQTVVNVALDEGICDRQILLSMADDLSLNEEQTEYFRDYVYYIME